MRLVVKFLYGGFPKAVQHAIPEYHKHILCEGDSQI